MQQAKALLLELEEALSARRITLPRDAVRVKEARAEAEAARRRAAAEAIEAPALPAIAKKYPVWATSVCTIHLSDSNASAKLFFCSTCFVAFCV